MMSDAKAAAIVAESIRVLAANPKRLDNMKSYLSRRFGFVAAGLSSGVTPEDIAKDMALFAGIDMEEKK